MRNRIVITIAVLLVIAGLAVAIFGRGGNDTDPAASGPHATSTAPPAPTGTGFADPVTDPFGRKVAIPNNPAGQPLPQAEPSRPRTECTGPGEPASPQKVMIQRSYGLPILVSESDGPTRLDGTVLTGYRQSPQGAVLAGWNWLSRLYTGGATAHDTVLAATALSPAERERAATASFTQKEGAARFKALAVAPDAFRVLSCDQEFVSVEWAMRLTVDAEGHPTETSSWIGIRLSLLWRDGDWKVQTSRAPSAAAGQRYTSIDGWTRWTL